MIKPHLISFLAGLFGLGCLIFLAAYRSDAPVASLSDSPALIVAARVSPITFNPDSDERLIPFEHALLLQLAEELKKTLQIIPLRSEKEVVEHVASGKAHLGAAWFFAPDDPRVISTQPFHADELILVQGDPSVAIESLDKLSGTTIHVPTGSTAASILSDLREGRIPSLTVVERPDGSGLGLMRSVAEHEIELTAAPAELASIAQNYFPEMQLSMAVTKQQPIVWITANRLTSGTTTQDDILPAVNDVLASMRKSGALSRLKDAHFAFRRRLTQIDTIRFIEKIRTTLPRYQGLFKQAQIRSDIDWRLLAALAYQESQWDPNAISSTRVRGMMMLTEETADRLGVKNRLDPKESILAGTDYLLSLRDELPDSIDEPDRTWMALAAYNLGMGHLRGGRHLAPGFKLDPDTWFGM